MISYIVFVAGENKPDTSRARYGPSDTRRKNSAFLRHCQIAVRPALESVAIRGVVHVEAVSIGSEYFRQFSPFCLNPDLSGLTMN